MNNKLKSTERKAVVISDQLLQRAHKRAKTYDWADNIVRSFRKAADFVAEHQLQLALPESTEATFEELPSCPQCLQRLTFDITRRNTYKCMVCAKTYSGPEFQQVWSDIYVAEYGIRLRDASFCHRLFPSTAIRDRLKEYLLFFGEHYTLFPERGPECCIGRVFSTAQEQSWLIDVLWIFDAIRDDLSEDEYRQLKEGLFVPMARLLAEQPLTIHNYPLAFNFAAAAVGYQFDVPELLEAGLYGPFGFYAQLKDGFGTDGIWFEITPGYQEAVQGFIENYLLWAGAKIPDDFDYLKPFEAVWNQCLPNGETLAMNDAGAGSSFGKIFADRLEIAHYLTEDQRASRLLGSCYRDQAELRKSFEALFFGPDDPASTEPLPRETRVYGDIGLTVLRRQTGVGENYAMLRWGTHGLMHEHFDRLQIVLSLHGKTFLTDPGTAHYGHPLHGRYYQSTAAHNAVVVDEESQIRNIGRLVHFSENEYFSVTEGMVDMQCPESYYYPRRTLVVTNDYVIDQYLLLYNVERTYDWIIHPAGEFDVPSQAVSSELSEAAIYRPFSNIQRLDNTGDWIQDFHIDDTTVRARLLAENGSGDTVYYCQSPGLQTKPRTSIVIRREASKTRFTALYDVFGNQPVVKSIEMDTLPYYAGWMIKVACDGYEDTILYTEGSGSATKQYNGLRTTNKAAFLRRFADGQVFVVEGELIE